MTLFEQSLEAMAHLLHRVGMPRWEAHIRSDIDAWQSAGNAEQHRRKYGGHSTYSDWVIHPDNKLAVTPDQAMWADTYREWLQIILQNVASDPNDPRLTQRMINSLNRAESLLDAARQQRLHEVSKHHEFCNDMNVGHCLHCGCRFATTFAASCVIADDVIAKHILAAYRAGTMTALVDTLLDEQLPRLTELRELLQQAATNAGIVIAETEWGDYRCAQCGSDDVSNEVWFLSIKDTLTFRRGRFRDTTDPDNETAALEARDEPADSIQSQPASAKRRLLGVAVASLAFGVLVAEFRYLHTQGSPQASGGIRASWGKMLLLGLPLVFFIGGLVQAVLGMKFQDCISAFSRVGLARRLALSVIIVAVSFAVVLLAAAV